MDSIKAWFKSQKPQHRSIEPQPVEKKNAINNPPKVRSAFQPARRPRNGQPSTTSIRTSLEIRKRESVVPAKRAAESDEQLNVASPKVPRLQEAPTSASNKSDQVECIGSIVEEAAWTPPKRPRPDNLSDEGSPTKKRKTDFAKAFDTAETDHGDDVQHSIELDTAEDVSIEDVFIARLKAAEVSRIHLFADDGVNSPGSSPRARPERLSSLKSPNAFRNQLQAYRESRAAPSSSAVADKDKIIGIGSWAGSGDIPGSRKRVENDANSIELPKKRPPHSRKSTTPDVLGVDDPFDVRRKSRGKGKAADVSRQRQMRSHRPWRLYDEDSLETEG